MKVQKKKMSYFQKGFYILSFIFLIIAFIYLGTKNYQTKKSSLSDSEQFTKDFGIAINNVFKYKKATDILEILNTGSGLIFLAYPENEWSTPYAEILNEVAKEENIKEIYFYNFLKDRENNNRYYENIVEYLKGYTTIIEGNTLDIYSPSLVIVKNGNIIYFDNETALLNGEHTIKEYWTSNKKIVKKTDLANAIKMYKGNLS